MSQRRQRFDFELELSFSWKLNLCYKLLFRRVYLLFSGNFPGLIRRVITSYSIHYTKLYDDSGWKRGVLRDSAPLFEAAGKTSCSSLPERRSHELPACNFILPAHSGP